MDEKRPTFITGDVIESEEVLADDKVEDKEEEKKEENNQETDEDKNK